LLIIITTWQPVCTQTMTIEQLQKPNVASKLVTKFAVSPPVEDRAWSTAKAAAARRPRPGGGCGGARSAAVRVELVGLAVTKTDELVMSNAGDDSILLYDIEGRLIRRIDQRQLLTQEVQQDGSGDLKLVFCTNMQSIPILTLKVLFAMAVTPGIFL